VSIGEYDEKEEKRENVKKIDSFNISNMETLITLNDFEEVTIEKRPLRNYTKAHSQKPVLIYLGDDTTDEDVFKMIQEEDLGIGILIS
jgi:trehalose-6-phosphatase